MLYIKFIILSLSFLLISCGWFGMDDSDRDTGDNTGDIISRPWDGTTINAPKYNLDTRTYYITDATHFAWIMKRTNDNTSIVYDNDTIILVNDIDMDNKSIQGIRKFQGTLDGSNKTIFNIQISRRASPDVGLIGELLDNGTIKNITIENGLISGEEKVGGIAGSGRNAKITNVRNINVSIKGYEGSIGGISGFTDNVTVELAINSGTVNGEKWVGGVIGDAKESSITKSANYGKLSGDESIGGIIGYNRSSSVSLSHNNGQIWKGVFIGGLIGSSNGGRIDNSSNIAKLEGRSGIGGVVGYVAKEVNISHIYNYGLLYTSSSVTSVGRLIGKEDNEFGGGYSKPNNFYLKDKSLEAVGEPRSEDAGLGIDANDFQYKGNFDAWDFNNIWKIEDKCPMLRWILTLDDKDIIEKLMGSCREEQY